MRPTWWAWSRESLSGCSATSNATREAGRALTMTSPTMIPEAPGAAVIGGGFIGPVHVEALRRIGVPVVGLLGSSPERARPTADQLAIARVYRGLDELLSDPKVAAVHVASPNAFHFSQAKSVLESGRHVICEKPLANSSQETAALCALAGARPGQAAAVNYNVRYYPLCHEIRERVARGDLGRILSITGSYVQDWLLYPRDYNWRVEAGGPANLRAIADIGTHWMDLAQFISGMPIRAVAPTWRRFMRGDSVCLGQRKHSRARAIPPVRRHKRSRSRPTITARSCFGAMEAPRGLFHVSQVTAGRKNRLTIEVAGSEGSAAWDSESPNQLWLGSRQGPNQVLERDPAALGPAARSISHYPGGHAEGFPDTFKQLFLDVYQWIVAGGPAGGRPVSLTFPTAIARCGCVRRSPRCTAAGRWVEVNQFEV